MNIQEVYKINEDKLKLNPYPGRIKNYYWNLLNPDNRISLLVKFIEAGSGQSKISIVNKNQL